MSCLCVFKMEMRVYTNWRNVGRLSWPCRAEAQRRAASLMPRSAPALFPTPRNNLRPPRGGGPALASPTGEGSGSGSRNLRLSMEALTGARTKPFAKAGESVKKKWGLAFCSAAPSAPAGLILQKRRSETAARARLFPTPGARGPKVGPPAITRPFGPR